MRAPLSPWAMLSALILSGNSHYLADRHATRIAGLMTENVALDASILAAERIIFGVTCGHPFLLHHMGGAIAMAEDPLVGAALAWHHELYDIQQTLLPTLYTGMTLPEDTPAPKNYLRRLSEASGVQYTSAMKAVAHMVYMPPQFLEGTLAAARERRSSSASASL